MIIAVTPTATGYEISIYDAYPIYFWGLIIFAQLMGITILIRSYLNEEERSNWKFGFLGLLVTNFIILSLGIIRNYFILGRNDVLSNIGLMNDILITGSINQNLYPITHIYGAEFFFIPNIQLNMISLILPIIFSLFFIISYYALFNRIFEDKKNVILSMVPSSLLLYSFYHSSFAPNQIAFLLIPFFLYSYFSSRKSDHKFQFAIITILLAILITLTHPLICFMMIIFLFIVELSNIFSTKFLNYQELRQPYNIILIMLIIFFMWQGIAYLFFNKFVKVFSWLTGDIIGTSQVDTYTSLISYAQPDILYLLNSLFSIYGQLIIIGLISFVTIVYLLKNRHQLNFFNVLFSSAFTFFILWSAITATIIYVFGFSRTYLVAMVMAVFLFFTFLEKFLSSKNEFLNKKHIKTLILCLIFVPLILISNFNLYYSPNIKTPNEQVTLTEYVGMQTFLKNRDDNFKTYEYGLSQTRFFDAIYYYTSNEVTLKKVNISVKNLRYKSTMPIDHFGYDNYTSQIDYYNKTSYLLINDLGKEQYPAIYPQYRDKWRFTPSDFEKLNNDNSLSLIYENSNLEIFIIGG